MKMKTKRWLVLVK